MSNEASGENSTGGASTETNQEDKYEIKRKLFLECALLVDRVLDRRYFPDISKALDENDESSFLKICEKDLNIKDKSTREYLWTTMHGVNTEISYQPGWILGL